MQALLQEWDQYLAAFGEKPCITELHLGGGTPTCFSAKNLKQLLEGLLSKAEVTPEAECSVEVHPNATNATQLQVLYDLGFRRLSPSFDCSLWQRMACWSTEGATYKYCQLAGLSCATLPCASMHGCGRLSPLRQYSADLFKGFAAMEYPTTPPWTRRGGWTRC